MIRGFWVFCCLVCISVTSTAQKKFRVIIKLDTSISTKDINFYYDDGRQIVRFPAPINNKKIILTGNYFSRYASLSLNYLDKTHQPYSNTFFIGEKSAQISLHYQANVYQKLVAKGLVNAEDVFDTTTNKTYRDLTHFNKDQNLAVWHFYQDHLTQLNSNDSLRKIYIKMLNVLNNRVLEFLKAHSDNYFSFWYFRHELTGLLHDINPDTTRLKAQLVYLTSSFPIKYTHSYEGKELIKAYKRAINPLKSSDSAPEFSNTTIDGKSIKLSDLKGKFVLLNFWATWCAPCMAEIPFLKTIRTKYSSRKLEMIGISQDRNLAILKQTIRQRNLNWKNIFDGQTEISRLYGINAFPTFLLIDENGVIIYKSDYIKDEKQELPKLLDRIL